MIFSLDQCLFVFTQPGNVTPEKRMPASITGFGGLSNKLDAKKPFRQQESQQRTENVMNDYSGVPNPAPDLLVRFAIHFRQ
jgi:hypothetical protein